MAKISSFEVDGLFGDRRVSIDIHNNALVIVGPNGIGKSTVATIFYYFISRQWRRLRDMTFDQLSLTVDGRKLTARRDEISGLSHFQRIWDGGYFSPRTRERINILQAADEADRFIAAEKLSLDDRKRYAALMNMTQMEVYSMHRALQRRMVEDDGTLFSALKLDLEKRVADLLPGRVLYLPTYRRIEKDVRDIFPDFEERYRLMSGEAGPKSGRSASHYIELVSFGMEDVKANLIKTTNSLRDYSLAQHNNLSGVYLRDVIRGSADKFSAKDINSLTPERITEIIDRVSEQALSVSEKDLLREKIGSIKGKRIDHIALNDRYLAHYFTRLMAADAEISKRETDISNFVEVCNAYLSPSKTLVYDERNFGVGIFDDRGRPLDMKDLSSGEKQIVSVFAHLYLEDVQNQSVIIDEPELSLSVPWQKRFLSDIQATGRCDFLFAVTHSPFIYENHLQSSALDLRRATQVVEA